jgi:hypothetical protein
VFINPALSGIVFGACPIPPPPTERALLYCPPPPPAKYLNGPLGPGVPTEGLGLISVPAPSPPLAPPNGVETGPAVPAIVAPPPPP